MNVFVAIMLVFAAVGFIDKMFDLKWGLAVSFDKGLLTMATMIIPIVGLSSIGVELMQRNIDAIAAATSDLPFDPSLIPGAILATDIGGFFMAEQLTTNETLLILNGVILASLLGQTVSFQLPVFLSALERSDFYVAIKGFIIGLILVPCGLVAAGLMLRMDVELFLRQVIPILILCILLAAGLIKFPEQMVKGFSLFARVIQWIIYLMFFFAMLGVFIPSLAYAEMDAIEEAAMIVLKSAIVISGSLVMSELVLKFFRTKLQKIADRLGINEVSMVALLLNCATSLAILPLFSRMDRKGKMLNAAFSVSGAYVLGGQLGFVSSVISGYPITVYVVSKVVCGGLSLFVMYKMYDRLEKPTSKIA
ncbi:MAG: ethanolamine utilization protein EutH [Bacillota bacterium]|nr:ethanolamine utilization protein EutH [Bacillota bacterium]